MPFVEVLMTREYLSEIPRDAIANELTKLIIEAEGLTDNKIARSIALVSYHAFDSLFIGGERVGYGKIIVKVHSFADALSEESRNTLFRGITNAFVMHDPKSEAQRGTNVWCIIEPVQPLEFAVGGNAITLEQTRRLVSVQKG